CVGPRGGDRAQARFRHPFGGTPVEGAREDQVPWAHPGGSRCRHSLGSKERVKKVVLDTNVVISALLFGGETARLVSLWQTGAFSWLASAAIIQEYARVLAYPKFKLAEAEIRELLNEDILP